MYARGEPTLRPAGPASAYGMEKGNLMSVHDQKHMQFFIDIIILIVVIIN